MLFFGVILRTEYLVLTRGKAGLCRLEVAWGKELEDYSFPGGHPFNKERTSLFAESIRRVSLDLVCPRTAVEEDLLLFHTRQYVDYVKERSRLGQGYLDLGDTPAFKGIFEVALYTVGTTLFGLDQIIRKKADHFFNPIGGLHHSMRDRAGGFCVFNDAAIAIESALRSYKRVAYIDIDAHHGDGVYYGFESDPRVIIGDIHEDGRFLFPGTGSSTETGKGEAVGTKFNAPLEPGAGDERFVETFDRVAEFVGKLEPEFIFFQCGADPLTGDPITHLKYSEKAHAYAAKRLHEMSHSLCDGRILVMGGGGYNKKNVERAWMAVARELVKS